MVLTKLFLGLFFIGPRGLLYMTLIHLVIHIIKLENPLQNRHPYEYEDP